MDLQQSFTQPLLHWFDENGRKNLPWQHPCTPYRIWIAEIMLQQTQVQTVIPYYQRFMDEFPNLETLYQGGEEAVLTLWSGLGYYTRARNLYKTACLIQEKWQGIFPVEFSDLVSLPGIGETTAAAILSQAFNQPTAILDGNVKRVLSRYFMIEGTGHATQKILWQWAKACMQTSRCRDYTQAIMDLGATCCTLKNPECTICPLQATCQAYKFDKAADYPTKKKPKTLPIRKEQFLLFHDNKEIFLEKRPPVGLWGGLWCLPSIESQCDPFIFMEELGLACIKHQDLLQIEHTFSHFKLHIEAIALQIEKR